MASLVASAGSLELQAAAHRACAPGRLARCTAAELRPSPPGLCVRAHDVGMWCGHQYEYPALILAARTVCPAADVFCRICAGCWTRDGSCRLREAGGLGGVSSTFKGGFQGERRREHNLQALST